MNSVVYLCHGSKEIHLQVYGSLLSLFSQSRNSSTEKLSRPYKIILYTDQAESVKKFWGERVDVVPLRKEQIQQWLGADSFIHRVKAQTLRSAAQTVLGDLIFLDGDTIFLSPVEKLFQSISDHQSLMHILESELAKPKDLLTKKIAKVLRRTDLQTSQGTFRMPMTTCMWNSGVIGIAQKNLKWTDEILELTDELYRKYQKHVMEQLAVSYILQNKSKVVGCSEHLIHYWDQKALFVQHIESFLAQYTEVEAAIQAWPTFQEKILKQYADLRLNSEKKKKSGFSWSKIWRPRTEGDGTRGWWG